MFVPFHSRLVILELILFRKKKLFCLDANYLHSFSHRYLVYTSSFVMYLLNAIRIGCRCATDYQRLKRQRRCSRIAMLTCRAIHLLNEINSKFFKFTYKLWYLAEVGFSYCTHFVPINANILELVSFSEQTKLLSCFSIYAGHTAARSKSHNWQWN